MTTFNEQDHPRTDTGKFDNKQFSEPANLTLPPAPVQDLAQQLEDLDADLYREMLRLDERRSDAQLAYQRVSLKTLGAGLKKEYPNARYLRLGEDTENGNEYWIDGLIDADGNEVAAKSAFFAEETLLHDNGHQVQDMVGNLTRRSVRWMEGVTDDDGEAAKFGQGGVFTSIDLDKAAALEVGGRPPVATRALTIEEQAILVKAAKDGLILLEDIVYERAEDQTPAELEEVRTQISQIKTVFGDADAA